MDPGLSVLVSKDSPVLNPAICNGLAVSHMEDAERYVDQVIRNVAKGFPDGLVYVGCKPCTPQEEFLEKTKKKSTRREYDVARSDIYMMKYFFKYKGEDLPPRYLYLPFMSDAGCITLGGSRFNISPILSDRVVSVGMSNIFVRLIRDRLTFERMQSHFLIDGSRETVQVAWSSIYHKSAKMKKLQPTVRANCTLMHYLFCKYGFTDTFLKFGGCRPIIGGSEVNKNVYPEDEWVICTSTQVRPKGVARTHYTSSDIRVAVRKSELTPMVRNMLGGFFYVVDHFPTRVLPEYVESKRLWMVLLGHIIFSGTVNEGTLHDDIADHIASLDEYLDGLVIPKLKEIGIFVDDIYQLFAIIIEKFNDWLLSAADKVSSMYDKELSILYYVLYEISSAIVKLSYKLTSASKKELTTKEVIATMNMTLKTGLIFLIRKNHGEVSNISNSGDNKAFKITAILVPQSGSNKLSSRKDTGTMNDPAKRLHVSVAEVGGYSNLPKSEPSGRSRLNPNVRTDNKSVIVRNPERMELLDGIQKLIRR